MFTFKILVLRGQANTTRPNCSILSYIWSTCALRRFTCVSIIDTHAYEPLPSWSSCFLRVLQVGPCRRPDNGHYPLSNGVRNHVHNLAIPTHEWIMRWDMTQPINTFTMNPWQKRKRNLLCLLQLCTPQNILNITRLWLVMLNMGGVDEAPGI